MNYFDLKNGDVIPNTGRTIKEIIAAGQTYIVYLDTSDIICWITDPTHEVFGNDFGKIQNQISYWESICNRLFKKKESFDYKCLLAEGYARMLDDGNDADANNIIKSTSQRIELQGEQILRQNYLISSLLATCLVISTLIVFVLAKDYIIGRTGRNIYEIFIAGFFGGIGAFVSTMIRAQNYDPELSSGKRIHQVDGILRIVYGLIAGVIVVLGVKANILVGFIDSIDKNIYILCFLGAISGASEKFLPNIIGKLEKEDFIKSSDPGK